MIFVVARLKIIPGQERKFEEIATELAEAVRRNEDGCKLYQLCKGDIPGNYVFVERYLDNDSLEYHKTTEYFQSALPKISSVLAGAPVVEILKEV